MKSGSPPRALFVGMPGLKTGETIDAAIGYHGLDRRLRGALSPATNRHQSFSERIFNPTQEQCDALLRVGAGISAPACTLLFNRIDGSGDHPGKIHCTLQAYGRPKAFDALAYSVKIALAQAGFEDIATGVGPHITLSYCASEVIDKIDLDPPIIWTIDELLLVIGGGKPYHYDIIGRWPLLPELDPPATQTSLF